MEKITFTPIVLRLQKPTEVKQAYIELSDDHLYFKIEFYADEPTDENDLELGWQSNVYNCFDIVALKKDIAGIEKAFTKDKRWALYIYVVGFPADVKVYFRSQTAAQELFEKIKDWLLAKV